MTELWLPGAKHVTPSSPGGTMDGTAPRTCVWHTTESPPGSIHGTTDYLVAKGYEPHIVWDPSTGEFNQLLPANESGRALENDGTMRCNRIGTIRVQIETIGHAAHPFTDGPLIGRSQLVAWLDQLGIPRAWPFGPLLPYPESYGANNGTRNPVIYLRASGHMGHSNVPGNSHGDPGAVSQTKLTPPPTATPIPPVPITLPEADMLIATQLSPGVNPSYWILTPTGHLVNVHPKDPKPAVTLTQQADWDRLAAQCPPIT